MYIVKALNLNEGNTVLQRYVVKEKKKRLKQKRRQKVYVKLFCGRLLGSLQCCLHVYQQILLVWFSDVVCKAMFHGFILICFGGISSYPEIANINATILYDFGNFFIDTYAIIGQVMPRFLSSMVA
jgi:hypothetical protein